MTALVEWEAIAKRFGPRTLFQDLSGSIAAGQALAVIGRNGSGKSTFLRILAGLQRPTRGRVRWQHDGSTPSRRGIGYASPDLRLYGELTGRENLEFFAGLGGHPLSAAEIERRLCATGLEVRDHAVPTLRYSSGMLQRVRLAFAQLGEPALLMLDEPGSNLDDAGRAVVEAIVAEQKRRGAVFIATNQPEEAALADQQLGLG